MPRLVPAGEWIRSRPLRSGVTGCRYMLPVKGQPLPVKRQRQERE
jgi:hypothetical protein